MIESDFAKELKYIVETATMNGYKEVTIMKLLYKNERKKIENLISLSLIVYDDVRSRYIAKALLFYPQIINIIQNELKKFNAKDACKNFGDLRDVLSKNKVSNHLEKSGIYMYQYKYGNAACIGQHQTKRKLKERAHEYAKDLYM